MSRKWISVPSAALCTAAFQAAPEMTIQCGRERFTGGAGFQPAPKMVDQCGREFATPNMVHCVDRPQLKRSAKITTDGQLLGLTFPVPAGSRRPQCRMPAVQRYKELPTGCGRYIGQPAGSRFRQEAAC